ncbi:hypothetical protein NW249_18445 [Streptomyces sp. OUCMDZ-4982]|uniref:hypothetical protein n=1 Tax=Streptomyces sp. OUCMDZ-4982 TaxID=2973090 RepID=UPI00215C0CFA|nr:hypothetical protein [Streptomyces sp. OUCMDZ-4982]MCR8944103.1 hypothetical protein [Streptomyces sp. OUCMDZ-4982]
MDAVVFMDQPAGKKRLVPHAPHGWLCQQVGGMAVTSQVERCGQIHLQLAEYDCGGLQALLYGSQAAADSLLLPCDQVQRHSAAVDGFDQLLPLGGEPCVFVLEEAALLFVAPR